MVSARVGSEKAWTHSIMNSHRHVDMYNDEVIIPRLRSRVLSRTQLGWGSQQTLDSLHIVILFVVRQVAT